MSENLVCVAKITSPHGVRGAVKVKAFTADPLSLDDYSPLYSKDGTQKFAVEIMSMKEDVLVVKIDGVTNRDEAAALRGRELYANKDLFPELDDDEFYYEDLIGMLVVRDDGREFGTVINVHNFGGGDLIEIALSDKEKTEFFSFTVDLFPEVDMDAGIMIIEPPEFEFIGDNDNEA